MATQRSGAGHALYPDSNYKHYVDTSFVTGESGRVLDFNTDLSRNAHNGYFINDGAGDIDIELSENSTTYGDKITLKDGESFSLKGRNIDSLRITWVANSAYRVFAE